MTFEAADRTRQGWLFDAQPLGGTPEMEFLRDRHEIFKLSRLRPVHTL
jgi:hypothetical protein